MESYKEAVIIGNGPSGITLSYMLAGNWPYYNGLPHPTEFLTYRLSEKQTKSLLEQDLEILSEGLEGRSLNPVSVLFDTLIHPQADLGIDNPSVISWKYDPNKAVDHVVLGKGVPGGSWQKMEGTTLTISLNSWMELPNVNIRDWEDARNKLFPVQSGLKQKRATVSTVADYYASYVKSQGLSEYFMNNTVVTYVSPVNQGLASEMGFKALWRVGGYVEQRSTNGSTEKQTFHYITPHVVLATGNSDKPNKLNVDGEDLPVVSRSLADLEHLIKKQQLSNAGPILIVGAGLSAADAIITARFYGIPVVHVFRRPVSDPDLIFNKLPQDIYPEYHKVHQMMKDSNRAYYEGYKAYPTSELSSIKPDGTVTIASCPNGKTSAFKVSHVLVLIGSTPNLDFLKEKGLQLGINTEKPIDTKNPVNIELYNHQCVFQPGLYAVGPLVGDNFVRFVQGGCLAAASSITNNVFHKTSDCR